MKATLPAAALAALLIAGCGNGKVAPEPVRPVLTQTVSTGAAATKDVYSGEVRARYETDLGFRVGGKIVARHVDAGARVAKGQVLARLDPEDAKLAANAARAQLASAESDFALSKAELERHADLLSKKFISQSAFDARKNAFNASQARFEQMRAQAAMSANQAEYTALMADADGVVISVAAEPGQVVTAGQPVLRLARAGEKDVVINVPEGQVARFQVNEPVGIKLWADPNVVFAGRVREIAGGADPVTRTYTVRVAALKPPSAVQLGMTASVVFQPAVDSKLVVLPLTALARDRSQPAVWVVDRASGKVQLRAVQVGQFREDGLTVTSGLQPGEVVVVAGVHKLRPDQIVRLADAPPAGKNTAQAN